MASSKCREKEKGGGGEEEEEFSQKAAIMLLKELQKFREDFGEKKDLKEFYKTSKHRHTYSEQQITDELQRQRDKFLKGKGNGKATDARDSRIHQLSQTLWGKRKQATSISLEDFPHILQLFTDDPTSPQLLRKNPLMFMDYDSAVDLEKQCQAVFAKQAKLHLEKIALRIKVAQPLLHRIHAQSSSSRKDEQQA